MPGNKPSIFISSTIQDLRDLRSALRAYLTALGFDVLLSEFNDFPKPLDLNAFEAALNTIKLADFYILIVGSRIGAMYDEKEGISITRKEYRTAYELAREGRTRLALFVRRELWDLRRDRSALRDYLLTDFAKSKELSPEDAEQIANHPGPLANDTELLFPFLSEISREQETQAAVRNQTDLPKANWVHTFTTFDDIVDALRIQLRLSTPLSTVALRANIRREILEDLILITSKYEGHISPTYTWAEGARRHLHGGMDDHSKMPGRYLRWACFYSVFLFRGANMSTRFINQALQSGEFLQYDPDTGEYAFGSLNECLFQLRDRIERFRSSADSLRQPLTEFVTKYIDLGKTENDVVVPNRDLVYPLVLADIEQDIVNLSIAVIQALGGDTRWLPILQLNPPIPFAEEAERISSETPTMDELVNWVKTQVGE